MPHKHDFKLVAVPNGYKARCACGVYIKRRAPKSKSNR